VLGAAQFGLGAAIAPLVGVLGNDAVALALVMTVGMVIALFALALTLRVGARAVGTPAPVSKDNERDGVIGDAVPEPA
jgi:DHA1 family bicyclomycin/chloramphenicol resistance-like MFS transporter